MSVPDKIETVKRKSMKLINAVDEVLEENNRILGDTPEERARTREAIGDLSPAELRLAAQQYRERQALFRHLNAKPQEAPQQ